MRFNTRYLILCALFASLTAIGAFMRIPLGFTSVTLQFLFAAMAGLLLGPRYGALSQVVYLFLGLAGFPVFTQGGGPGYVLTPTFGFLLGLIPAAWLTGFFAGSHPSSRRVAISALVGLASLYLVGVPYLYFIMNFYLGHPMSVWDTIKSGMLVFLPGEAVKIAVLAFTAPPISRAMNRT